MSSRDKAQEFVRLALGGRVVSKEAWEVGCHIAEQAMRAAERVVPVEMVPEIARRAFAMTGIQLTSKAKLAELMAALDDFGMKPFTTDSKKLARIKAAYHQLQFGGELAIQVPRDIQTMTGLPMPEKGSVRS
jgi:hypothetical protein